MDNLLGVPPTFMNLCESNRAVSAEIKNFILNVPNAKEESITDYLVWKWRELDKRFNYINITLFTRIEESATTGADFELELWLVGRSFHFPLVFQAKKFVKPFDSYYKKLNYHNGTQSQLTTLLNYAKSKKRLPFYVFYSLSDAETTTMCGRQEALDTGVFMADAHTIKKFADGIYGHKIPKNDLLSASNPFHCMFCCPLFQDGKYFRSYFSSLAEVSDMNGNGQLPKYVNMLLNGRMQDADREEILSLINQHGLRSYRAVAVYDMRGD